VAWHLFGWTSTSASFTASFLPVLVTRSHFYLAPFAIRNSRPQLCSQPGSRGPSLLGVRATFLPHGRHFYLCDHISYRPRPANFSHADFGIVIAYSSMAAHIRKLLRTLHPYGGG
jgi:hypothetical protein